MIFFFYFSKCSYMTRIKHQLTHILFNHSVIQHVALFLFHTHIHTSWFSVLSKDTFETWLEVDRCSSAATAMLAFIILATTHGYKNTCFKTGVQVYKLEQRCQVLLKAKKKNIFPCNLSEQIILVQCFGFFFKSLWLLIFNRLPSTSWVILKVYLLTAWSDFRVNLLDCSL